MKKRILLCLFLLQQLFIHAQQLYFPPITGTTWETISPDSLGWCTDKIDSLYQFLETNNSKGFIVLKIGRAHV